MDRRNTNFAWSVVAVLTGVVAFFNPYLQPGAVGGSPRASDIMAVCAAGLLLLLWVNGRPLSTPVLGRLGAALVLVLAWLLRDAAQGDGPAVQAVRWMIYLPYGYLVWTFSRDPRTRYLIAGGFLLGIAANLCVVALQRAGYGAFAIEAGLAQAAWRETWVVAGGLAASRPVGMWGHPNAAMGVIALALPITLGMVDEGRAGSWFVAVGVAMVAIGSAFTFTRSGAAVAAVLLLIWALHPRARVAQRAMRVGVGVAIVAAVAVVGPPGGWGRWADPSNIAFNSAERLMATIESAQIAFANPMGVGMEYREVLIRNTAGTPATHNAWVYLALVAGLPLMLLVLAAVVRVALTLPRRPTIEGWIALNILGLSFFEEYFRLVPFMILSVWMIAAAPRLRRKARDFAGELSDAQTAYAGMASPK